MSRSRLIAVLALGTVLAGRAADGSFSLDDLQKVYTQAADRATELVPDAVIAVVDRDGRALLVRRAGGSDNVTATERAIAVAKAGTAVFLSSNQQAFTSRSAGFIIQQNFPPGVLNRPPGPLVGVGFSNLAFSDVNYLHAPDGSRIPGTRLFGSPGGVPIYKNGILVAGIGVTGDGTEQEDASITGPDSDEAIALAGQIGFTPAADIIGSNVFIDGISVDYVDSEAKLAAQSSGRPFDRTGLATLAPVSWPMDSLGGVTGEVHAPIRGDPLTGAIDGQARLTEAEVRQIIANAAARTLVTRAGIRLPPGQVTQVFITVVNNPAQAGVAPSVLGTFRTPDATIFSWDVAVQKARTAVFFSSNTRAFSTRTVGFLAQSMYPPGINGQPPGPFHGLQEAYSIPLLTGTAGSNPNLPNGITIFPGGFPLYRNGVLIGAIGVSGDGIDDDDLIAASGTLGFQPAPAIRADNFLYTGARLPYAKFPRDAQLRANGDTTTEIPAGFESLDAAVPAGQQLPDLSSSAATGGTASPGLLPYPVGVAVDGSGNTYVSDASANTISKVTSTGQLTVLAGTTGQSGTADGSGAAARFNSPGGLLIASDGAVIVSDTANGTIRRITSTGVVTTLAGSAGVHGSVDGAGAVASFSSPTGLAQDSSGALFVVDAMNDTIRRIGTDGTVSTLAGSAGLAGDTDGAGSAARFNHPTGLAVDGSGNLYLADSGNNTIRRISTGAVVTTLAGLPGVSGSDDGTGTQALFNNPGGVAVDAAGNVYVADTGNSAIRRVTSTGVVTTIAGLPRIAGLKDGLGTDAWFNQPRGLALAANGSLYVADTGNAAIRLIASNGAVSTLAVSAATSGSSSGSGATGSTGGTGTSSSGGSSSADNGGGGGAPSLWFSPALGLLLLLRRRYGSRRSYTLSSRFGTSVQRPFKYG